MRGCARVQLPDRPFRNVRCTVLGSVQVLEKLAEVGVKMIAMRCAGFDKVNLAAAEKLGIQVARVPTYSPHSVAEHAVGLCLCLNRCASLTATG